MKILFIAPSLPVNNGAGHAIRSYQIYNELKAFASVDVITASSVGVSFPLIKEFRKSNSYISHVDIDWKEYFFGLSYPLSKDLEKILSENEYDYVFIRYFNTAYRLGAFKLSNLILDCDDCILELMCQQDNTENQGLLKTLLSKISNRSKERNYVNNLRRVNGVIFSKVSSKMQWENNFYLAPNKIKLVPIASEDRKNKNFVTILFVGVLNYAPNYEGLFHFVSKIFPGVVAACSNVRLKIVGSGLPPEYYKAWSKNPNIEICGYVPDINSVYADVDIAIAPIYKGSGTHIKVMEALVRSIAMVISPLAHRGYEHSLLDSDSLFVADSVELFTQRVIELSQNSGLRKAMGSKGRKAIISHHAIENSRSDIEKLFGQLEKNKQTLSKSEKPIYEGAYE